MAYAKIVINNDEYDFDKCKTIKRKPSVFELDWEEMLEIFGEFRDKKAQSRFRGNECWESAMKKAEAIFKVLPQGTDY